MGMKKLKLFTILMSTVYCLLTTSGNASLFDPDKPIVDGINVIQMSDVFADIYEKLDGVKWGGRGINIAIESLENLDKDAHIAATDNRVVLVWRDTIVGNWPRPIKNNWTEFGQVTTALVLRLREHIPAFRALPESGVYEVAVGALINGLDENGRYIYSKKEQVVQDGRLITSAGIEGTTDNRGNFRVSGVFKGGLADEAGIRDGDLITEINGASVSGMNPGAVTAAFAGFNSGTLRLNVLSPSGARNVTLRRATIVMADSDIIWRDGILEIVVHRISDNSANIIREALLRHTNASGIIIDLRAAAGDDERAAAKLAGLFMGRVPVLRSSESAKEEIEITPGGDAIISEQIPIIVLVSGGTRGTGEALAAAFYENHRGLLVGTPTAGRARLATRIDLRHGGQLEVLNRSIKTGSGRVIEERGIFPIVCLSTIRSTEQQNAFFVNVVNGQFGARDFNAESDIDGDAVRRGCPGIISGADEDAVSAAVAIKILTDRSAYNGLMR